MHFYDVRFRDLELEGAEIGGHHQVHFRGEYDAVPVEVGAARSTQQFEGRIRAHGEHALIEALLDGPQRSASDARVLTRHGPDNGCGSDQERSGPLHRAFHREAPRSLLASKVSRTFDSFSKTEMLSASCSTYCCCFW